MRAIEPKTQSIASESVFVVRGDASPSAIVQTLRSLLPARHQPIAPHRFTLLDTFDGRVRRAGAQLTEAVTDGCSTFGWQASGAPVCLTARAASPVGFIWDFPEGPLRDAASPVVGVRRMFAQADAEIHGSMLEVLDARRKTVARVRIESGQARLPTSPRTWRPLPTMVTVTALRGYEDACVRLVPVIESRPSVIATADTAAGVLLKEIGAPERDDLSIPRVDLQPNVRADEGARQIHRALLANLNANEPGLRDRFDTEFLHDFRVALRRTRALLGQIRDVFPSDRVEHFAGEFSWIGRAAGPARDLDVLVLALRGEHDIPTGDILDVMAFLIQAQAQEHRRLVDALDSNRYQMLQSDWQAFLDRPGGTAHPVNATRPLGAVVAQRAWRLSRRIAESASAINDEATAADIHQVRIAAKKLRYLIDVTPAFYDPGDLATVVHALKKLQRVLGDFNDAQVQEGHLLECGRALGAAGGPPGALVALGRLAEKRRQRRAMLRTEVVDRLSRFGTREIRSACRRIFKQAAAEACP